MVNRRTDDITTAKLLAQDILKIAQCRKKWCAKLIAYQYCN